MGHHGILRQEFGTMDQILIILNMNINNVLNNLVLDLTEKEAISAHSRVVASVLGLNHLMPDKYRKYNLTTLKIKITYL